MADSNATASNTAPSDRSAARKRGLKIAAIAIVALAIVIWLAFWLYHRLTHVSENDARVQSHEITVSSRLDGRVTGFDLIEGDHLSESEKIAQLYSAPDTLQLDALKARIDHIRTQLELARQQIGGGVASAKTMLAADIAAMHAARSRMQKAHANYVRAQNLYEAKGGTEKQRDIYRYDYRSARANHQRAQSQVARDKIAIANAKTGLLTGGEITNPDVLASELKIAEANLAHQRNMIDDLTVRSPIKGVVDQTFIERAEYISAGQPILMMHDPNDVWIEANIKETEISDLAVGQPVHVQVDAHPDIAYRGHVQVIGRAATNQFALLPDPNPSGNFTKITQRIPVRIAIDHGPKPQLAPGMMVEVDIDITGNGWSPEKIRRERVRTRRAQTAVSRASEGPAAGAVPADRHQNGAERALAAAQADSATAPSLRLSQDSGSQ